MESTHISIIIVAVIIVETPFTGQESAHNGSQPIRAPRCLDQ
jgi:hypothetical protein